MIFKKFIKNIHKNENKKNINITIKDFMKNNKNNKIKIKLGLFNLKYINYFI